MWKPGTEKPSGSLLSKSSEKKKKKGTRPNLDLSINDGGGALSLKAKSPSSATPRKRLSGGTMNMRFMKRRKSDIDANKSEDSEKPTPDSQRKLPLQNNDVMDIESDNDNASEDESKYAPATSVDMYGIEASLIGRRSFRGFNAPIERIWKDSKGRLENRGLNDRPGKKVSDEELLQRYKDIARERGSRGVGNLDKKNKKRR